MEKFDLSVWLQDKSRKVVTRSGHNVRILCTDQRGNMPIVALVEFETLDGVQLFYHDGKNESHREYDLFFADEKMTEFEKMLRYVLECYSGHEFASESEIETLKLNAKSLLELARKELENNDWRQSLRSYKDAYEQGKRDALKEMKEALQTEYEKGRSDMMEKMMKALIGGEVVKDMHNQLSVKSEPLNNTFGDIKFGEKVKIIIVKPE